MKSRKNALLLFTKPPLTGLVKTRLSVLKDGIFSAEQAAYLYHCMLFDVMEICCDALSQLEREDAEAPTSDYTDIYDFIISTTPAENVEVLQKMIDESGSWPRSFTVIADTGSSFDEHYNCAFDQVWDAGYDTVLSLGGDMPALPRSVVVEGFRQLQDVYDNNNNGGMVISADQEMGVSLVGWTRETNMTHDGVFYNPDGLTVLPAYVQKSRAAGVPMRFIPAVPDVDTIRDLAHNVTLVQAVCHCANYQDLSVPWRTAEALEKLGFDDVRVPPNELRDSREGIDTPAN